MRQEIYAAPGHGNISPKPNGCIPAKELWRTRNCNINNSNALSRIGQIGVIANYRCALIRSGSLVLANKADSRWLSNAISAENGIRNIGEKTAHCINQSIFNFNSATCRTLGIYSPRAGGITNIDREENIPRISSEDVVAEQFDAFREGIRVD